MHTAQCAVRSVRARINIIIITIYLLNIHLFHTKLGLDRTEDRIVVEIYSDDLEDFGG